MSSALAATGRHQHHNNGTSLRTFAVDGQENHAKAATSDVVRAH